MAKIEELVDHLDAVRQFLLNDEYWSYAGWVKDAIDELINGPDEKDISSSKKDKKPTAPWGFVTLHQVYEDEDWVIVNINDISTYENGMIHLKGGGILRVAESINDISKAISNYYMLNSMTGGNK